MMPQGHNKMGEFALIRWIQQQAKKGDHLTLGIGDDCSVQPQRDGQELLTSTDLLIEDVHFKRAWSSMYDLGRKAAAVNISDIAAMGGTPQSLFLSLGRPDQISDAEIQEFVSGFIAEAESHGAVLAGGDSCRSTGPLVISVTVQGTIAAGEAVYRHGASYGDAVYVSGCLGDSALALQLLLRGEQPDAYLAERFHTPSPRVDLGVNLARSGWATAMLDISDGLIADLGHIMEASGVGAEIELARLPLSGPFSQALLQDTELIELALAGGEDYELVFTSPLNDLDTRPGFSPFVTRIGAIRQEPGLSLRAVDGSGYECRRKGYDHFG